MGTPESLKVQRPYDSRESYLEGDAWTVSRSDVLLVDGAELAEGTAVKFEIALAGGEVVVRGEGRVAGTVGAEAGRPGGLRVRFRQLDSESKAMLKRALEVQKRSPVARPDEMKSAPDASVPARTGEPPFESKDVEPSTAAPVVFTAEAARPVAPERSGVRHRAVGAIVAPGNRDTLLARLRERVSSVAIDEAKRRTAGE
jgi:hypothetical protein